jgi:hypothetical protein
MKAILMISDTLNAVLTPGSAHPPLLALNRAGAAGCCPGASPALQYRHHVSQYLSPLPSSRSQPLQELPAGEDRAFAARSSASTAAGAALKVNFLRN